MKKLIWPLTLIGLLGLSACGPQAIQAKREGLVPMKDSPDMGHFRLEHVTK